MNPLLKGPLGDALRMVVACDMMGEQIYLTPFPLQRKKKVLDKFPKHYEKIPDIGISRKDSIEHKTNVM